MTATRTPPAGTPAGGPQGRPGPTPPPRRLVRRTDDRMVAGVASGLASYFDLDPVVFRIGFVLLTVLGGAGIPLYLVLWLIMPRMDRDQMYEPIVTTRRVTDTRFYVGIAIAALGAIWLADEVFNAGGLFGPLILIGIGIALFSRDREDVAEPVAVDDWPAAETVSGPPSGPTDGIQDVITDDLGEVAVSPPLVAGMDTGAADPGPGRRGPGGRYGGGAGWAPPAAQPYAQQPPRRRRRRSILGRLTMATLLVWAGFVMLLDNLGWWEPTIQDGLAGALIIVGAALFIGTWVGRARWLVVIGLMLLPGVLAVSVLDGLDLPLRGTVGERDEVVTVTALDRNGGTYRHVAGELQVDLRELVPTEGEVIEVAASVTFGELRLLLPDDVRVEIDSRVRGGELWLLGRRSLDGVDLQRSTVHNPDATSGVIHVDAEVGFGALHVRGSDDMVLGAGPWTARDRSTVTLLPEKSGLTKEVR